MRVDSCRLLRLGVPFRNAFRHAEAERDHSDCILVVLEDPDGHKGIGEILARSYVTGETNDDIFTRTAGEFAAQLGSQQFESAAGIVAFIRRAVEGGRRDMALLGGFEIALLSLWNASREIDWTGLLGPERESTAGKCVTLGFEVPLEELERRIRIGVLAGATAFKLKVGGSTTSPEGGEDTDRILAASRALPATIELRLDANGQMDLDRAARTLSEATRRGARLHSIEQPLAADLPDLEEQFLALREATGVAIALDESVCTPAEWETWSRSPAADYLVVRTGKCGGITAARRAIITARKRGKQLLGGTMVGETGVLNAASTVLLRHSPELPYMEGLGQNRFLLEFDPVDHPSGSTRELALVLRSDLCKLTATEEKQLPITQLSTIDLNGG